MLPNTVHRKVKIDLVFLEFITVEHWRLMVFLTLVQTDCPQFVSNKPGLGL